MPALVAVLLATWLIGWINKLYPFPMAADQALATNYLDLPPEDLYSIGRMGTYRYLDIANIVEQCFELQDKIGKAR
jgi:UDP-galactopyranose mutase